MRTVVGRKRLAVCAIPLAGARFAQVLLTPGPTGISDCISVKPGTMEVCRGTGAAAPYDAP